MGPTRQRKKTASLGTTFGDSLGYHRANPLSPRTMGEYASFFQYVALRSVVFIGFLLLVGRLFQLTVVDGSYYHALSENNRVRQERIQAPRGVIYDRNGEVLAGNRPIYKDCNTVEKDGFFTNVCNIISREKGIEKEAKKETVLVELGREYKHNELAAHAVGYMTEVDQKTLETENKKFGIVDNFCQECYGAGDFIGVTGIEEAFEKDLRGIPGKRLVEVGSDEKELQELARVAPIPGKNIYTSLDLSLQKVAREAIEKVRTDPKIPSIGAAAIASNPKTGEIYAFYSSPTFDPNAFVGQDRSDVPPIEDYLTDTHMPLFNRVLSGLYPPGSTFKIVTTSAGLEEGALTSTTTVEDTGVISVGKFSFANWYFTQYGGREGEVGIVRALARSNDIFFYKVGEWLGIEKLDKWGKIFKNNDDLGIEIPGMAKGTIKRDREWFLGDTYHASIGQGDVLSTPLHVNTWAQIIANDGAYCPPTLLKKDASEVACTSIGLHQENIDIITQGMIEACSTGGTAWPLFNFAVNTASGSASTRVFHDDGRDFKTLEKGTGIQVACKTGTAELGHPDNHTHAWVTGFAPVENPEIVVTVLVEEGGEGSSVAGPVVKEILAEWFSKERE